MEVPKHRITHHAHAKSPALSRWVLVGPVDPAPPGRCRGNSDMRATWSAVCCDCSDDKEVQVVQPETSNRMSYKRVEKENVGTIRLKSKSRDRHASLCKVTTAMSRRLIELLSSWFTCRLFFFPFSLSALQKSSAAQLANTRQGSLQLSRILLLASRVKQRAPSAFFFFIFFLCLSLYFVCLRT